MASSAEEGGRAAPRRGRDDDVTGLMVAEVRRNIAIVACFSLRFSVAVGSVYIGNES